MLTQSLTFILPVTWKGSFHGALRMDTTESFNSLTVHNLQGLHSSKCSRMFLTFSTHPCVFSLTIRSVYDIRAVNPSKQSLI